MKSLRFNFDIYEVITSCNEIKSYHSLGMKFNKNYAPINDGMYTNYFSDNGFPSSAKNAVYNTQWNGNSAFRWRSVSCPCSMCIGSGNAWGCRWKNIGPYPYWLPYPYPYVSDTSYYPLTSRICSHWFASKENTLLDSLFLRTLYDVHVSSHMFLQTYGPSYIPISIVWNGQKKAAICIWSHYFQHGWWESKRYSYPWTFLNYALCRNKNQKIQWFWSWVGWLVE